MVHFNICVNQLFRKLLLFLASTLLVQSCTIVPPCGYEPTDLKLTDNVEKLHIEVAVYDDWCNQGPSAEPKFLSMMSVEYDVNTKTWEEDETKFIANALGENDGRNGLGDMWKVPQDFAYEAGKLGGGVYGVKISYLDGGTLNLPLDDFESDVLDDPGKYYNSGVLVFYSKKYDRFYILYSSSIGNNNTNDLNTRLAICDKEGACMYQYYDQWDFYTIDLGSNSLNGPPRVFDVVDLVALPMICCLCVDFEYFEFSSEGIVRRIEVLSSMSRDIAVDTRNGIAYASFASHDGYSSENEAKLYISSEKISSKLDDTVTPIYDVNKMDGDSVLKTQLTNKYIMPGFMFDVKAFKDIKITKLGLHMSQTTNPISVELYTRSGTFQGFQRRPGAWSLLGQGYVIGKGYGGGFYSKATNFEGFTPLTIMENDLKGVYITLVRNDFGLYGESTSSLSKVVTYNSNPDLKVFIGCSKGYPFGLTEKGKAWNGIMYYENWTDQKEEIYEISSFSALVGSEPSDGVMFEIESNGNEPIVINGVDIQCRSSTKVPVKVYTRDGSFQNYAKRPGAWTEVLSVDGVTCQGEGKRTNIPSLNPIVLSPRSVKSMYVTISNNSNSMRSTKMNDSVTSKMMSNNHLTIFVGIGKMYPFKNSHSGYGWNGAIRYSVGLDEESKMSSSPPELESGSISNYGSMSLIKNLAAISMLIVSIFSLS